MSIMPEIYFFKVPDSITILNVTNDFTNQFYKLLILDIYIFIQNIFTLICSICAVKEREKRSIIKLFNIKYHIKNL